MKYKIQKIHINLILVVLLIIIILLLQLQFYGCNDSSGYNHDKTTGIVVSILPQSEFIEKVGEDKFNVTVMIPPGASPHTYEPAPSQLEDISNAVLYAKVGSGIEFELAWMDKIIKMNREMYVLDCSKGIELLSTSGKDNDQNSSGKDPHIWLSPLNAKIMVENIYNGIAEIDPGNKDFYYENKISYQLELDRLDDQIRSILSDRKNRKILVFHPAWTYLAEEYGLVQIAVEQEGKGPTIKSMERIIDQARKYDIKVIFASPEFSTKSVEAIAEEIDGSVVLVSPLEKDYIKNLKKVVTAFAASME